MAEDHHLLHLTLLAKVMILDYWFYYETIMSVLLSLRQNCWSIICSLGYDEESVPGLSPSTSPVSMMLIAPIATWLGTRGNLV